MVKDWEVLGPSLDDPFTHVYPRGDEKPHLLKGTGCWCNPTVKWDNLVIHSSADCREVVEEAERILNS